MQISEQRTRCRYRVRHPFYYDIFLRQFVGNGIRFDGDDDDDDAANNDGDDNDERAAKFIGVWRTYEKSYRKTESNAYLCQ